MEIILKKETGNVVINGYEIEIMVEEQLKMIPGIVAIGRQGLIEKFKSLFRRDYTKAVHVYPTKEGEIGVTCHVQVAGDVNFVALSQGVQETLKFSIQQHYGLSVKHIDILIEGIIER